MKSAISAACFLALATSASAYEAPRWRSQAGQVIVVPPPVVIIQGSHFDDRDPIHETFCGGLQMERGDAPQECYR